MENYHPTVQKITDLLETHNCEYKSYEHEAVRTSEEAAAIRPEYTLAQGAKALLIRVKSRANEKYFVQIVVPGDAKFDVKKVCSLLDAKDIRFATEAEVAEITDGVLPGGVPPFGNLFGLPVYVEDTLLKNAEIIFNAGDRRFSVAIKSSDYVAVVKPKILDLI